MLANGFLALLYSLDTMMVGALSNTADAGTYSIASRLAQVILFAMNAAQAIASPLIVEASLRPTNDGLKSLIFTFNRVALIVAVPVAIGLAGFAHPILRIFGPAFADRDDVLRVLVAMQVLNVLTGPTGMMLSMLGLQGALARLLALGVLINVLLNLVWIPAYGPIGAAYSSLVAHAIWNTLAIVVLYRRHSVNCTVFGARPAKRTEAA